MRLLLVNYEYPPTGAGAATATAALAREFVALGHKVLILTGGCCGLAARSEENGISIQRLAIGRRRLDRSGIIEMTRFLFAALFALPGILRRHGIEGIIAFFSLPSAPVGLLAHYLTGIPYVVSLRGGDVPGNEPSLRFIHWLLTPLRRTVLRRSCAIVANSVALQQLAEAADPFPVSVIPNGVDTVSFDREEQATDRSGPLRILFVGRLQPQKNLGFVLQAMTTMPAGGFELHVAGDGPDMSSLQESARSKGLAVTWHGWKPRADLPEIYRSCDCLVLPSLYEGMSNTLLEAMASGLPVVGSRVRGNEDLIRHGENGFLFDLDDTQSFSYSLVRLQDQNLRRTMGAKARSSALEFSWKTAAAKYLEIMKTCGGVSLK